VQLLFIKITILLATLPRELLPRHLAISQQLIMRKIVKHQVFYGIYVQQHPEYMTFLYNLGPVELNWAIKQVGLINRG
jgi:hypothetical protein